MATEIRVPVLGESVTEATIGKWFKKAGEAVLADEPLVELETDKVTLEVNAPASGTLAEIIAKDGETVAVGALLGKIGEAGATAAPAKAEPKPVAPPPAPPQRPAPAAPLAAAEPAPAPAPPSMPASPAAAKIAADHGVDTASVEGSGKRGQVLKGDVLDYLAKAPAPAPSPAPAPAPAFRRRPRPRPPARRIARSAFR